MTDVLKELLKEFEQHKGEFVIDGSLTIKRFIGISEDEFDFSYVLYNGRELYFETALTKLMFLKGKLDDYDYDILEKSARLNHDNCLVEDNFEFFQETPVSYKMNLLQKYPYEEFHTDLIFKSE